MMPEEAESPNRSRRDGEGGGSEAKAETRDPSGQTRPSQKVPFFFALLVWFSLS